MKMEKEYKRKEGLVSNVEKTVFILINMTPPTYY
jgi:hypothetical protein